MPSRDSELEAVLFELDERCVWLGLNDAGGVRYRVPDSSPEGVPRDLLDRIRARKADLAALLKQLDPLPKWANPVPFVSRNLEIFWLRAAVAPLTRFEIAGRSYYRLTPRVRLWIDAALRQAKDAAKSCEEWAKFNRRGSRFCATAWMVDHFRPDQFERAGRLPVELPKLRPGEVLMPQGLIEPLAVKSRRYFASGSAIPILTAKPLAEELPEVLAA